MKKKWNLSIVLAVLAVVLMVPVMVSANAAEPPSFTIIVTNPPEDLDILLLSSEKEQEPIRLSRQNKAWEGYYRFFRYTAPKINDFENTSILVQTGGETFEYPMPYGEYRYNTLLTLDLKNHTVTMGQPFWREPLLIGMRILCTLGIEGILFWIFGYRSRRSWIIFLLTNLVTQGGLNFMITGPGLSPYWMIGFVFGEVLVLLIELAVFCGLLKEFRKRRAVGYTVIANLSSLLLGGMLLSYLPV